MMLGAKLNARLSGRVLPAVRLIAAVALLLAFPGTALALPGDPPITQLAPADGAQVSAAAVAVGFTCPDYRKFAGSVTLYGDYTDYEAIFATKPDLGSDGRLLGANVVDRTIPTKSNTGCASAMDMGVKPGTFYWQAARQCEGCATGYETSVVRSFVVHADLHLGLTVPKTAYGGYPVIASVRAGGVADGGTVTVQRRAGKKWKKVASTTIHHERGRIVLKLPRGRVPLRVTAVGGVSHARVVKVVAARNWTTTHDVGSYRGKAEGADLTVKVAGGGRQLRDFDTEVTMFCVGPTIPDNHLMIGVAPVKRAKIAPDGRFYARNKHGSNTVIELSGRVHNGRVKGQVELTVGTCDGTADFNVKR
jgi:hypothetical protein